MSFDDNKYNDEQFHFTSLNIDDFIQFGLHNIMTIWLGRLFQSADILLTIIHAINTNTRKGTVDDILVWKQFSHFCFTLNYNAADWPRGLYKLNEFSLLTSTMNDPKINHLDTQGSIRIATAYHPLISKRIIVDGFHRATALEIETRELKRNIIPNVEIWECYGRLVHTIFPFEFSYLLTSYIESKESGNLNQDEDIN